MPTNSRAQQPQAASQLWVDYGLASDVPTNSVAGASEATFAEQPARNGDHVGNNNYVDFQQFIMQHNLIGGSANGNSLSTTFNGLGACNALQRGASGGGGGTIGDGLRYFAQATSAKKAPTAMSFSGNSDHNSLNSYQPQANYYDTAANQYQVNNSNPTDLFADNLNSYTNTAEESLVAGRHFFDNLYTPFGDNTTTYFSNPFATGFNFNATKLQANAPEFIPRFNSLSLSENVDPDKQPTTPLTNGSTPNGNGSSAVDKEPDNGTDFVKSEQLNDYKSKATTHEDGGQDTQKAEQYVKPKGENRTEIRDLGSLSPSSSPSTASSVAGAVSRSTGAASKTLKQAAVNGANGHSAGNGNANNRDNRSEKASTAARENRRFQNGRRLQDYNEREDRYERYVERGERGERGGHGYRGNRDRDRDRDRDYHQRFDNHRSNKRRDDWNRNRDRINGFRVEEKYSSDTGKESPLPSPEKKSPKKIYPENEKLSQREKLVRDIETRRLECLVCVEPIKAHHGVWSCNNCYHILHLQCIIKWASSSKSDDGWRCPACQNVVKDVPRDYYCFCGKLKNPPNNRQDIAHSCGEVCGRVEGCAHACTLLCHPGPCPPCQANVRRECGCGKTTKTMQCYVKEPIECEATCDKLLNCEVHTCNDKCHDGKCAPCTEKVDQKCHCSKQERQVVCTRESHDKHTYSCGKPCGKDLTCGNHKCKDCCHPGECRPCKQSPEVVTSCPCGKMPILEGQRSSCLDPIPVCEGVCGKTLRCGKAAHPHHCTSKCHLGNCPPCNKQTAVKCRCGHMDQMIKCRQLSTRADDARCKKRCVKKRSCGKHKCNQECCIDIDHICPLPCNYTLSCGKHKCDQPCHRGNCPPCYRSSFEELYCECGAEVIYPPVPCGTKRPLCKRPCSRQHPCEHPPQHNCHSAATCPPCMMFTTKWCFGQHEQRKTIPCSQQSFSCGLACNKPLPCGRHKCIKTCHEGVCQTAGEVCKQSCTTLRATCGHKCMAPCHDGDCPETPCKEMVEVQCECGNRKQMRTCYELVREYSRITTAQLASSMAEMQRGNYMELSEILAPVKLNKTNKTLDCNEECRLLERNRRLAIGLQIRNPDLPQKLMTKYSDFIRNFAKRDPALVKSIHDALTTLVKLAKESKQKSRSHSFPTMNREKRQLVHEMCEMFGVESVAYDAEPNRNVVATAYKDRSWLPATSIMEVMQRESGQRRVPVPSNNAWGSKR